MTEQYLTIEQAMTALGVARRTVFKYLKEGKLRRFERMARTVIPLADVEAMLLPRDTSP